MREVFFLAVLLTPGICSCVPAPAIERVLHDNRRVEICNVSAEPQCHAERA
jgi:hypothetical protein